MAQFGCSLYEFQVWGTGGSVAAAYPALPREQTGTCQNRVLRRLHGREGRTRPGGGTYDFTSGRSNIDDPSVSWHSPCWGLPQPSVDRVAAGGVQAEIDWVRVERKR